MFKNLPLTVALCLVSGMASASLTQRLTADPTSCSEARAQRLRSNESLLQGAMQPASAMPHSKMWRGYLQSQAGLGPTYDNAQAYLRQHCRYQS